MKELIKKIEEFNEAFGVPVRDDFGTTDYSQYMLRYNLMKEENEEYLEACVDKNKIEIADALGDKLYILLGTIVQHGLQDKIEEVFNLIHENNMSKLHNGVVLRNEAGKIIKPEGFKSVDLTKVIN